jgi:hypothetical protein
MLRFVLYVPRLRQSAEQSGFSAWADLDIRGGDLWRETITFQASHCRIFLVVLTKGWLKSRYCLAELDHAKHASVLVVRPWNRSWHQQFEGKEGRKGHKRGICARAPPPLL